MDEWCLTEFCNPYTDQGFFGFFVVLLQRMWLGCRGYLTWSHLASDEIQLLVLVGISVSGALLGAFLVLRRMTMLANALSHTLLLGIVIVHLILKNFVNILDPEHTMSVSALVCAAFVAGVMTTLLTDILNRVLKLQTDASIGLVFTVLFALGVILVTLYTKNSHLGIELVMGNVDALQIEDLMSIFVIGGINVFLVILFFPGFVITTFDPTLARTFGFSPLLFTYLLMIQTAATSMSAFRAVGILMILAFFVFPVMIARLLTHVLKRLIVVAIGISCGISLIGVALSRHILTCFGWGVSTGGLIVCLLGICYFVAVLFNPQSGLVINYFYRRFMPFPSQGLNSGSPKAPVIEQS